MAKVYKNNKLKFLNFLTNSKIEDIKTENNYENDEDFYVKEIKEIKHRLVLKGKLK